MLVNSYSNLHSRGILVVFFKLKNMSTLRQRLKEAKQVIRFYDRIVTLEEAINKLNK